MLNGERPNECSACYQSEDNGITSARQSNLSKFSKFIPIADATNLDGSVNEVTLKYFDLRWSNICNLKCRSCSSTYSSSWATEDNNNGHNKKIFIFAGGDSNDNLYNQFEPYFAGIEEFYFAGGEPLLTDKHYDILEHLISIGRTDVKLQYNTNLTNLKYKDKSVLELWKQFSNVEVFASLDSWGNRAEYIREGTDWNVVEHNLKTIKAIVPHVKLQISSVISIFNVSTILEFLDYIFENNLFDKSHFYPNFYNLINPYYYSTNILPDIQRLALINKLSNANYSPHINQQIKNVILHLENSKFNPALAAQFVKVTAHYDSIRNKDFKETFPELNYC
jgi:sulfatase maturation enzyme AslB (radical SAM superfamily)